nr:hypothetical protein GZ27B6_32 [uncultured archaeon GZfos27B6]
MSSYVFSFSTGFLFFFKKRKSVVLIVWNLVVHYLQFITGMTIICDLVLVIWDFFI